MFEWLVKLTFMTTGIPLSARIRGANSDPLYASRFFLQRMSVREVHFDKAIRFTVHLLQRLRLQELRP